MDNIISVIASPLPFLAVISVVITVHELGHYWVGRSFGAAVESFSLGFGPPIFEVKDKRGTRWRLNWLPLGGFVKFVGESQLPQDVGKVEEGPIGRHFTEFGPLKRMAVAFGGPLANFIFAIGVIAAFAMIIGVNQFDRVEVKAVAPDSAAQAAGFQPGDVLVKAGGWPVLTSDDVVNATQLAAGDPVPYTIRRGETEMDLTATPIVVAVEDQVLKGKTRVGRIGLEMNQVGFNRPHYNPVEALGYSVGRVQFIMQSTVRVISRVVTGRESMDKFTGPVGILRASDNLTDMVMKEDRVPYWDRLSAAALQLIMFAASISIAVGFFNLLPLPVLDGGMIVMCIAEVITGKQIPEKLQRVALTVGAACILCFALFITWNDISRWLSA